MKTRIREKFSYGYGQVMFYPQYKGWFFWNDFIDNWSLLRNFRNLKDAQDYIDMRLAVEREEKELKKKLKELAKAHKTVYHKYP